VIIVFLFRIRSALIPIRTLALAVLATFIPMYYFPTKIGCSIPNIFGSRMRVAP